MMILLVTSTERAGECAEALHNALSEEVVIAESLARATALLRAEDYQAVVFDQYLVETEPDESGTTLEHLGTAIPVQVNLAISGMERLVRDVRVAVQRRQREEVAARRAALGTLQSEANGTVTALLLSTELAMDIPDLPPAAFAKLQAIHELVKKLSWQLGSAERAEASAQAANG
ncbi:MAG: hypothetical protein WBW83_02295 [Terriglobales bacterium]